MFRVLVLVLGLAMPLAASRTSASPATPPSVAHGERLDGREPPPQPTTFKVVPRALLLIPRALFTAIMVPTAWAGEAIEKHHLYGRLYWAFTSDDQLVGVRPVVVFESSSVLQGGLRYFDRRLLGDDSLFQVRARAGGLHSMFGDLTIEVRGLSWGFEGERRNDATFAGIEGQTKDELEAEGFTVTRFGFDRLASQLAYEQPLGPWLSLQTSVDVGVWDFNNGTSRGGDPTINEVFCTDCAAGTVDETLVPGFNEGTRRVRGEVSLLFDSRAHPRYSSGVSARITVDWAHGFAGDPSHDVAASAVVGGELDLGDRALGVRLTAAMIEPVGDDPVPFISLIGASGRYGIRALRSGRLRGNSGFVGTLFYRYLLTPNIDFMLFADYGGAFGRWFDGVTVDHLIDGYGASLWLYSSRGRYYEGSYLARIEAAWAPGEGSRIVLVTGLD